MSLNSWRGGGLSCCFRHPTLKPLKSPNQRWRTGWVARGSLGTGILVPGIVQNECTFNPHPLFPAISLHSHLTPPPPPTPFPLLCHTPKQTSPCHPVFRMAHSEVGHLPHQASDPVPAGLTVMSSLQLSFGFQLWWCPCLHLMRFTVTEVYPYSPWALSCDTVAFVLQDTNS